MSSQVFQTCVISPKCCCPSTNTCKVFLLVCSILYFSLVDCISYESSVALYLSAMLETLLWGNNFIFPPQNNSLFKCFSVTFCKSVTRKNKQFFLHSRTAQASTTEYSHSNHISKAFPLIVSLSLGLILTDCKSHRSLIYIHSSVCCCSFSLSGDLLVTKLS